MSGPDIMVERRMAAASAIVWRCLAEPGLVRRWFAPRPRRVTEAVVKARPRGRLRVAMAGPDEAPR